MGQGVYAGEGAKGVEAVPDDVDDGEEENGADLAKPLVGQDAAEDAHEVAEALEQVDDSFSFRLGVAEDVVEVLVENPQNAVERESLKHLTKKKGRATQ